MRIYLILTLLALCNTALALDEPTTAPPVDKNAPPAVTPSASPPSTTPAAPAPATPKAAITLPAPISATAKPETTTPVPATTSPATTTSPTAGIGVNTPKPDTTPAVVAPTPVSTTSAAPVKTDPVVTKEKILNSINKMSSKEIAELLNFITAMEESVSNTPAADDNPAVTPNPVKETLKRIVKVEPDKVAISAAPIRGLYEATFESEVIYVSSDGRYVLMGDLRDAKSGRNFTEEKRNKMRVDAMNSIKESELVVFTPKTGTKETINVFTDVDCPYCSRFHQGVNQLTDAGIKVRYFGFPRAGIGSETYKKMVSVWCADDKQQAITDAKAGRDVKPATCTNSIDKQYELGKKVGVSGTPALVLSTGELIPGFVPPEKLIPYLFHQSGPILGGGKVRGK